MRPPLYLTFDDGPDPVWTPRVADLLARHGAFATFFVLGWRVRETPEIVGELLAAGHRVELHGDTHVDHALLTSDQLARDTEAALDTLSSNGVDPQWWRPPFGTVTDATRDVAAEHHLRIAGWDADTHDWRGDVWAHQPAPVSDAAARGGVVLLHDALAPGIGRESADNTLEVADLLLQHAARRRTPVLALPDSSTTEAIPTSPGPSPFGRTEATRRAWRARQHAADAVLPPLRRVPPGNRA